MFLVSNTQRSINSIYDVYNECKEKLSENFTTANLHQNNTGASQVDTCRKPPRFSRLTSDLLIHQSDMDGQWSGTRETMI